MARLTILEFTKGYQEVVEAFKTMIDNPTITEREEKGTVITDVEGDFSHLVLEEMGVWQAHIKVEIRDNQIKDDADREARSVFAVADPVFGRVLFSPTIAYVYKRVEAKVRTRTIIEQIEDGVVVESGETEQVTKPAFIWKDITREFGRKVQTKHVPGWE